MKTLFIAGSDELRTRLLPVLTLPGEEFVWYRDIVKAMDNVEEIEPDCVVIAAVDYPRHWKTFVHFARQVVPAEKRRVMRIILVCDRIFPRQEQVKARFLGARLFFIEYLYESDGTERFKALSAPPRHAISPLTGRKCPQNPAATGKIGFVFTHPASGATVTGKVRRITTTSLIFQAENPRALHALRKGAALGGVSLRAGGVILHPQCRLGRVSYRGAFVEIQIDSLSPQDAALLKREIAKIVAEPRAAA